MALIVRGHGYRGRRARHGHVVLTRFDARAESPEQQDRTVVRRGEEPVEPIELTGSSEYKHRAQVIDGYDLARGVDMQAAPLSQPPSARAYPDQELRLVMDNYAAHKKKEKSSTGSPKTPAYEWISPLTQRPG